MRTEMNYTPEQVIQAVVCAIPYPQHVKDWDLSSVPDAVRFTWRSDRFRVSLRSGMVEQEDGRLLCGSNIAILVESMIRSAVVRASAPEAGS